MDNAVKLRNVSASIFQITPRRYHQMVDEGVAPPAENGKIDFLKATKAIIIYYRNLAEHRSEKPTLAEERRLKLQVERKIKELELMISNRELIPANEVPRMFDLRKRMVRQGLERLCKSLTPKLAAVKDDPRAMSDVLKAETRAILTWFSQGGGVLTVPSSSRMSSTKGQKKGG